MESLPQQIARLRKIAATRHEMHYITQIDIVALGAVLKHRDAMVNLRHEQTMDLLRSAGGSTCRSEKLDQLEAEVKAGLEATP